MIKAQDWKKYLSYQSGFWCVTIIFFTLLKTKEGCSSGKSRRKIYPYYIYPSKNGSFGTTDSILWLELRWGEIIRKPILEPSNRGSEARVHQRRKVWSSYTTRNFQKNLLFHNFSIFLKTIHIYCLIENLEASREVSKAAKTIKCNSTHSYDPRPCSKGLTFLS